jgi:hypothetical protein
MTERWFKSGGAYLSAFPLSPDPMLPFSRLLALLAACTLPSLLGCTASQLVVPRAIRRAWRAADTDLRGASFGAAGWAHSPWYPYKDPIWRQLRPAADAPVYLIESQATESGMLYGVAWSGTDTLTYEVSGKTVHYGREANVDHALGMALVQWQTGPCPAYEAPNWIHKNVHVLQVYWPDGRYQVCRLYF